MGDDQGVAGAAVLAQAGARVVLIVTTGVRGTGAEDGEEVDYEQRQATGGEHLRVLHNSEAACKKSDFCFQLGGKAEFMTYK